MIQSVNEFVLLHYNFCRVWWGFFAFLSNCILKIRKRFEVINALLC